MTLKLYNTLSKRKENFNHLKQGLVLYYTCGPTVHDYAHIGNFRTFVFQDVLKRWLEHKGHRVRHVMNITDVDEKTIERSRRKKTPLTSLTRLYEKAFFEDLDCLNIKRADLYPRVSSNIEAIAKMVEGLYKKGHAFVDSEGSYYFDVNTFKGYGRLSGICLRQKIRAKTAREDYKTPKNFLLWKACNEDRNACWETVLGKGRPGWHIECAALAEKYLGRTIDIHSGGIDLVFPHHENEIAEAEAYTGQAFTRYWVHVEHLLVYGKKMSKSMGNFFTLRQVIKKGFDPRAMRLLYLATHYKSKLNFSFKKLRESQRHIVFIEGVLKDLNLENLGSDDYNAQVNEFKKRFSNLMDEDLGTDEALHLFIDFLRGVKKAVKTKRLSRKGKMSITEAINWVDGVFGILEECRLTP